MNCDFIAIFHTSSHQRIDRMNGSTLKKLAIPLLLIGLLGVLAVSLSHKEQAPNVTFTTIDGKKIAMSSLKGKLVLVNFWATDCPGCIKEMPELVNTYKQYKDKGFELIAVTMPYDPPAQVLNYVKMKALPFPVMQDGYGEMQEKFGKVTLVPTTFIYDKKGNLLRHNIGELNFTQLHQQLDVELAKSN